MLGLERDLRPRQFAAVSADLAQFSVQGVDVAVGVGEHKPLCRRLGRGVALPGRYERRTSLVLVLGPGDRPSRVIGRYGIGKPSFGQVLRGSALPIDALPGDFGDFGRAMAGLQLGEQPAALDRGELAVVAGEDQLGAGGSRGSQ